MINRIIVSGFGGQGVILIGKILGVCGYEQGIFSTVLSFIPDDSEPEIPSEPETKKAAT